MTRQADLDRFYALLNDLADRIDGPYRLKNCTGRMDWPDRGLYIFLEPGETRERTDQRRLTRVGTHAVSAGSSTTMWDRLKQHYGTGSRSSDHPHGGNHRGSVYRKRVGEALIEKYDLDAEYPSWHDRWSSIERDRSVVRDEEYILERRVSTYIREQPFLWVPVDDEPSPESDRAYLEANSIALVSNFERPTADPRADDWLGRHSRAREIRESGLWNVNHVGETYDPAFLDRFETVVEEATPA